MTFKKDDPSTPQNEAWEPVEVATEFKKPEGKYATPPKIKPNFKNVKTVYH